MTKQALSTNEAPKPIGPYSQAVQGQNLVFLSGQIPLDPHTNQVVGTTVQEQGKQVLQNIHAVLAAAGLTFQDVLKTTVYLKNIQDFQAFNELYAAYFLEPYPARVVVEVARLPKDVLVEMDVIAGRSGD